MPIITVVEPCTDVQAVILAGGRGQRLRPITDYLPKALIPIDGIPILEWQIRYLARFGITDVVVCSGYKTEMLSHFLSRNSMDSVALSVEGEPLGTGGAIRKAAPLINGQEVLVMNGDVITDIDPRHIGGNGIAAIPLRTKFGILQTDKGKVMGFEEKAIIHDKWMSAGLYRFDSSFLGDLPKKGDIERTLFPEYAKAGRLGVTRFPAARWYSVDSFKDMKECSAHVRQMVDT